MKKTLIALVVASLAIVPTALAQETFDIGFRYDRSELSTPEGSETLYQRLKSEIRRACDASPHRDLKMKMAERQCITETTETAVEKINSQQFLATHEARGGLSG